LAARSTYTLAREVSTFAAGIPDGVPDVHDLYPQHRDTTLSAAITLAEHGFALFPCLASKAPACPHGHLNATNDPAGVRELWGRWPGPLIGAPTGSRNGFDVLDIDPRHRGDTWHAAHRNRLPLTRIHETRSGGLHILFRHREGVRNSAGKIASGIDVRGEGGFVIWWPAAGCSVLADGLPADWPDWLLMLLFPPAPPRVADGRMNGDARAVRLIERALFRVRAAPPGQRHMNLRAAACTLGGLLDVAGFTEAEAERELFAAALAAGGNDVCERNARATIAWGLRKGRQSPLLTGGDHA
jgi:hypothetical protein